MTYLHQASSDWLRVVADLAEKHPFKPITRAGSELQSAFVNFLRNGAGNEADPLDMLADLMAILPRFQNALVQANHNGSICRRCAARYAGMLFNEIVRDAGELAASEDKERKH